MSGNACKQLETARSVSTLNVTCLQALPVVTQKINDCMFVNPPYDCICVRVHFLSIMQKFSMNKAILCSHMTVYICAQTVIEVIIIGRGFTTKRFF